MLFYPYVNKRRSHLDFSLPAMSAHAHLFSLVLYRGNFFLSYPIFLSSKSNRPKRRLRLYVRPSLCLSVGPSVIRTLFLRHFTSSRCIFLSFHVIHDVFRAHFTSFFSLPRPTVHLIFTSNNHSFFSHLFQV